MKKTSDKAFLLHISDAINEIFEFTKNGKEAFYDSELIKKAVSKDFEIIGEAAGRISASLKDVHKHIPWQKIKDFRNVLVHDYFDVDYETMWKIMETELPKLKIQIENILKELG